jgi:hypothetical protein
MATTEPRTDVITASHKRALRNADSIVFELTSDGQAQIRAIKRAEYSTTGFDQTVTIYVGGARVSDYGKQTKHYPEQHTYTAFHMEMNSSMDNTVRTLVNRVKIGGFMNLVWTRDNNNELLRHAGLHQDVALPSLWPAQCPKHRPGARHGSFPQCRQPGPSRLGRTDDKEGGPSPEDDRVLGHHRSGNRRDPHKRGEVMNETERLAKIAELHHDSGFPVQHWCTRYGGSMEDAHEPDAPHQCYECGPETAWPCETYKLATEKEKDEPCPFTFAHTRQWCGNPNCREK